MSGTNVPLTRKPDGSLGELEADDNGKLKVSAEITQTDPLEVVIADQQTAVPDPGASGINVHIIPPGEVLPRELALTVTLPDDEPSRTMYLATRARGTSDAGNISSVNLDPNTKAMHVAVAQSVLPDGAAREDTLGSVVSGVDQTNIVLGAISGQLPAELEGGRLPVESELEADGPLATDAAIASLESEVADDAKTSDVQEVRDRLPQEGGRLAVETELSAAGPLGTEATAASTLAAVDTLESKLGTLAAQEATTAKDTSVDGLEALATAGNATAAAISSFLSATFGPYTRTSFGQIRVAERVTMFDNLNEYALDPRAWGTRTANGGAVAFNATTGMTEVTVTGVSGSSSELRTHTQFIYQPGAITRPILTLAHVDGGQTNQRRRWGFFNDSDGLFFELNGTALSIVRRTSTSGSPVDNPIPRASWDNPYNALSLTNGSRYEIDLQWLSFGVVHFWVNATLVHTLDFANSITLPYTRTAQLPLSIEVVNTGASVASGMRYVCSTVYLDGGTELKHVPKSRALTTPKTGIGTTYTPLIGLRMRTTVNSRTNRKVVIPAKTRFSNASGRATVAAIMNPASTTGGSWTAVDSLSGVEYNEGITSYTGGTEISRLYLPNTADTRELDGSDEFALNGLHLRQDAFGAGIDTILFVGKADVGTTDLDVIARWTELG